MKNLMLKEQFKRSDRPTGRYAYSFKFVYPRRRNKFFRVFSTFQEKSCSLMHKTEYVEYPLKIRVRRAAGLPDSYEDLPTSLHGVEKCWKNNSKRPHQWVEIDDKNKE